MKNVLLLIGFILFCLAGVAGIPSWPKSETSVGYFKISKNSYGVAVYQDVPHASIEFVGAQSFVARGNVITFSPFTKIVYGRDDIIFDATSIYTNPTQEQIDYLQKNKVRARSLPQIFYLVNPHIPGLLEFRGSNMQIDLNQKQIEGSVDTVIVHDSITI